MGTSSGSCFNNQSSMLPPRQQPRPGGGGLQTSLSLISPDASRSANLLELGADQAREAPSESASSRETWPTADALVAKKIEKDKEAEDGIAEHSVIRNISRSDNLSLQDIARERVDVIAETMQNLPDEYLNKFKHELRALLEGLGGSHQREEFLSLQKMVQSRVDLSEKTLTVAHRIQLEILVAMKTGIQAFLLPNVSLSQASLIDIFLYKRCKNLACESVLPADDCSCELCSKKNGFCSHCMCVICTKFDFEVNTCRWIGCDLCSHWTHTDCAIRKGQVGMAPWAKNGVYSAEMIFMCRACCRTSELLGWVKDVFQHCAPSWDRDASIRELDYVRRIFCRSEDPRGKELLRKSEELIEKLKSGVSEPIPCKAILTFFQELERDSSKQRETTEGGRMISPQEAFNNIADVVQEAVKKMEAVADEKMRMVKKARLAVESCEQELKDKAREVADLKMERQKKKIQIDELESIVRLKQAEADMFELKANEALREAERLQRIALAKTEKEDDYESRYLKQRLQEAETEKQYLFETIKLQESSRTSHQNAGGSDHLQMYNKIQDLLKNMCNTSSKAEAQSTDLHSLGGFP
ncbi:OBERON-like protein [Andrographis paniculata]|uniref:OBERON-like protein n=1 Tax=Andrographis paniculata TaxID=175694 RepID=UPI0021E7245F|nr:OBERON-like protein [Andrographis paniculata]